LIRQPYIQALQPSQKRFPQWQGACGPVLTGEGALDSGPECHSMTWLADVGEFVNHHVVDQRHRKLRGCPVDIQPVVLAEGAPPVPRMAHVEGSRHT
jgi:hypothetical protein